jgi:hypothetical protein
MNNAKGNYETTLCTRAASTMARPIRSERALPISGFRPEAKTGEVFSPIGVHGLSVKSGRPAARGRRWSGRGASQPQGGGQDFGVERGNAHQNRAALGGTIRAVGSNGGGVEKQLRPPEGWSASIVGSRQRSPLWQLD